MFGFTTQRYASKKLVHDRRNTDSHLEYFTIYGEILRFRVIEYSEIPR